jgi:hypothetical protein
MSTRERLRQEIEVTRVAFHHLLDSIPDEALSFTSGNPAWTIGQVLFHISIIPRYIFVEVQMIRKQRWIYILMVRMVPKRVFDWLNAHMTRLLARRLSHQSLSREYERTQTAVLRALDAIPEADFSKTMTYPFWDPLLTGEVSVEYLFGYIKRHFDSHAKQIEEVMNRVNDG